MGDIDFQQLFQVLQNEFMGISLSTFLAAFGFIFGGYVAKRLSAWLLMRLKDASDSTKFKLDDIFFAALGPPLSNSLLLGGFYLAISILPVPEEPVDIARFVSAILRATSTLLVVWFMVRFVDGLGAHWEEREKEGERQWFHGVIPLFRKSARVTLWVIGAVIVMQSLGYSVSALMAGLGLGGAAIAFASKDTIANVFGSLVVMVDRPFKVGDWVVIGGTEGTVEEIGLRVTRIRTFANSLITMPNAQLTSTAIENWSQMKKRRINVTIGVTYDAKPDRLEEGVRRIRELLRNNDKINQDFYLVNFTNYGAYSLDILLYCFTKTTDWAEHLQARQELLLDIMHAFDDIGLEFAFPTQTLHLLKSSPPQPDNDDGRPEKADDNRPERGDDMRPEHADDKRPDARDDDRPSQEEIERPKGEGDGES